MTSAWSTCYISKFMSHDKFTIVLERLVGSTNKLLDEYGRYNIPVMHNNRLYETEVRERHRKTQTDSSKTQ